jgi:hypothetical protein
MNFENPNNNNDGEPNVDMSFAEQQRLLQEILAKEEVWKKKEESNERGPGINYREQEQKLVLENPQFVGVNIDHIFTVDARTYYSKEELAKYYEEKYKRPLLNNKFSEEDQKYISEKRDEEKTKIESLPAYLEGFKGKLTHARIHPIGEASPVSVSQAIKIEENGDFEVKIYSEFISQIRKIKEKVEDLTIVVPFYNHRLGKEQFSNIPNTKEQINQYIAICEKLIENFEDSIQLEIGNETNVSNSTGEMFKNTAQFGDHVDSKEYSEFLFEVSSKLKIKNENIRISLAGVVCFDPTYIRDVLSRIKNMETENNISNQLIDTISFHPYREDPENGSSEIKNGNFTHSNLNYNEQLEIMKEIASEFNLELTVGEINFSNTDPEGEEKLKRAISLTAEKGVESYIYPREGVK